jgi:hypothetical protein
MYFLNHYSDHYSDYWNYDRLENMIYILPVKYCILKVLCPLWKIGCGPSYNTFQGDIHFKTLHTQGTRMSWIKLYKSCDAWYTCNMDMYWRSNRTHVTGDYDSSTNVKQLKEKFERHGHHNMWKTSFCNVTYTTIQKKKRKLAVAGQSNSTERNVTELCLLLDSC